jgi:hypothetical protein
MVILIQSTQSNLIEGFACGGGVLQADCSTGRSQSDVVWPGPWVSVWG